ILAVTMPLVAGFVVAGFGFKYLFLAASVIIIAGFIPLFHLQNIYEKYQWSFIETFRQFFSQRNRNLIATYLGDGAQKVALVVLWPLFVFLLLDQKYIALGAITAFTLLAVLVIQSTTGSLFDKWDRRRVLVLGAIISSTGWLIKIFVGTPIQIFVADTYHGFGRVVNRTSVDALGYEQAADNGRYVDEYTVLKEMASGIGKAGMLIFAGVILFVSNMHTAFLVSLFMAALATLATMFLSRPIRLH
ncbi:MAG: hypothetical protein ACE5HI_20540, partial [bacterium]